MLLPSPGLAKGAWRGLCVCKGKDGVHDVVTSVWLRMSWKELHEGEVEERRGEGLV